MNDNTINPEMSHRAVSLYNGGDGMDDFPVLKAFQQYIDAEQEKARKRIMGLGLIFAFVLVVVVAVFMFFLIGINQRNQALSDRLVEYAMKDSERRQQQTVVQPPVAPVQQQDSEAVKAIAATLEAMQKKMSETEQQRSVKPTPAVVPEVDSRVREQEERLAREKAQLLAEKKRLADEKERLHQMEIEQQRRKLYPELYGETPKVEKASPSRSRTRTLTDDDIREIIEEAYPEIETARKAQKEETSSAEEVEKDVKKSKPTNQKKQDKSAKESDEDEDIDEAIEYFKDDNYAIPVDSKDGKSKVTFTVPVD